MNVSSELRYLGIKVLTLADELEVYQKLISAEQLFNSLKLLYLWLCSSQGRDCLFR